MTAIDDKRIANMLYQYHAGGDIEILSVDIFLAIAKPDRLIKQGLIPVDIIK